MKSGQEVVVYIDDYYKHALERPHMFALTPQELEGILYAFQRLRDFIVKPDSPEVYHDSYGSFLMAQGHGTARFTPGFYPDQRCSDLDVEVFDRFARFWKEFQEHEKRSGDASPPPR